MKNSGKSRGKKGQASENVWENGNGSQPLPSWLPVKSGSAPYQMPDNRPSKHCMLHLNENHFADNDHLLGALDTLDGQDLSKYPVLGNSELCDCLCDLYGARPEEVLIQLGCSALLGAMVEAFVEPGARVLLHRPAWSYYDYLVQNRGGEAVDCPLELTESGYQYCPDRMDAALAKYQPRLTIIGSPNNPTGNSLDPEVLSTLAQKHPETIFLVDETYLGFSGRQRPAVGETLSCTPNVVLLRSLSKFHALAGIRIGFAFAHEQVMKSLQAAQPTFGISVIDQRIAVARLRNRRYADKIAAQCLSSQRSFARLIQPCPELHLCASDANFVLLRTPAGKATAIRDRLQADGCLVAVKDFDGLDQHLRITLAPEVVIEQVAWSILRFMSEQSERKPLEFRFGPDSGERQNAQPRTAFAQ